jgi:hypothetical protein
MTTSIKVRTNGSYVAEAKDSNGSIVGKAGPGSNVESDWIHLRHADVFTIAERDATTEEVEAAKAPKQDQRQRG